MEMINTSNESCNDDMAYFSQKMSLGPYTKISETVLANGLTASDLLQTLTSKRLWVCPFSRKPLEDNFPRTSLSFHGLDIAGKEEQHEYNQACTSRAQLRKVTYLVRTTGDRGILLSERTSGGDEKEPTREKRTLSSVCSDRLT